MNQQNVKHIMLRKIQLFQNSYHTTSLIVESREAKRRDRNGRMPDEKGEGERWGTDEREVACISVNYIIYIYERSK